MSSGEFEIKTESFDNHEEWKIDSNPNVPTFQIDGTLTLQNVKEENQIHNMTMVILLMRIVLVKCEPQGDKNYINPAKSKTLF